METMKRRRIQALLMTGGVIAATVLSGCGTTSAGDNLVGAMRSSHVLQIGTSNDVPWSSVNSSGQAVGIIPDILREYIKRAGLGNVSIQSTPMPFGSLIPSLLTGRIELIGDAIFNTPSREKQVQFTTTTFYNTEALVVAKGNPKHITSIADLCGHVGATYVGTSWVQNLKDASAKCPSGSSINVKTYATVDEVIQDIANGRVDGGLIDSSISAYAISQNPGLNVELAPGYVPLSRSDSNNALAVGLKDKTFVASFNKIYAQMLADGTVAKIFEENGLRPAKVWLP